jgi:heme exporter protein D
VYFESVSAALQMDGHGVYVWVAYGVCAVVLSYLLISPQRRKRRALREIAAAERRRAQAVAAQQQEVN